MGEPQPRASNVTITRSDGWYVAKDDETGVASQGETRPEALTNLAEALELHDRTLPDDANVEPEPSTAPWFADSEHR